MRHFTEDAVARMVACFATDQGMCRFRMTTEGVGPDATAMRAGESVAFEFKACATWVADVSKPQGRRPGRFRVDPNQHAGLYGTARLFYVFINYDADDRTVTQVRIMRSDLLPQRDTVISLSAFSQGEEVD